MLLNLYQDAIAVNHTPSFYQHMQRSLWDAIRDETNLTAGLRLERLVYANFARLNVYYEVLNVLERKQIQSITLSDLFANIGGTIGLWAGLSIITLIEVIFFLSNLAVIKCKKTKGKKKTKPLQKN